jgi:hypothetical protein
MGQSGDIALPADFDGDGKSDVAIYRTGEDNWYRLNSNGGGSFSGAFGQPGDSPLPASVHTVVISKGN